MMNEVTSKIQNDHPKDNFLNTMDGHNMAQKKKTW